MTTEEYLRMWKRFELKDCGSLNLNTLHTFDKVYGIVTDHMANIFKTQAHIDFRDIDRVTNPSSVRFHDTPSEMLNRTLLPRAVSIYNLDTQPDVYYDIPSGYQLHRLGNTLTGTRLLTIRKKKIKVKDHDYDYMKDIDVMLIAPPRHSTATIMFSVLVSEDGMALELYKLSKFMFPLGIPKPIFYSKEKSNDGDKIIPYYLETILPEKIVEGFKTTFNIKDRGTDGDRELLQILQEHSDEQIDYIVDGGNRNRAFAIKYPSIITIIPQSIDMLTFDGSNTPTHGVKIELLVDYIDLPAYNLIASMDRLNTRNPDIFIEEYHDEYLKSYEEINIARFSDVVCGCTLKHIVRITYDDEDIRFTEDGYKYIEIDLLDLVCEDEEIKEYLNFLMNCYHDEERKCFMQFEVKRLALNNEQAKSLEYRKAGNDPGITVNDTMMTDITGKPNDQVYVALFIDKKHYNDWREKKGYITVSNLSAYN